LEQKIMMAKLGGMDLVLTEVGIGVAMTAVELVANKGLPVLPASQALRAWDNHSKISAWKYRSRSLRSTNMLSLKVATH
jgi:hypothetical protein